MASMTIHSISSITPKETRLLTFLFQYRGLRAKDLTVFESGTRYFSLSQERSVYNCLAKLKKKGLVKSYRLQGVNSLGSLYSLTEKGLEMTKNLLNISIGQNGNGYLPMNEYTTFWDVPYSFQNPPTKQTEHFLLTIDFFKELVADQKEPVSHQTNFYARLDKKLPSGQLVTVKPDALVTNSYGKYAIEIDRATEGHYQLVEKFKRYRDYHHATSQDIPHTKIRTIVFVVESRSRTHGIQRRWRNLFSAFLAAFDQQLPEINLVLIPMDEVAQFFEYENKRLSVLVKLDNQLESYLGKNNFSLTKLKTKMPVYTDKQGVYAKVFSFLVHEFDSNAYRYALFLQEEVDHLKQQLPYLEPKGKDATYKCFFMCWNKVPRLVENIDSLEVTDQLRTKLKESEKIIAKFKPLSPNFLNDLP